MKLRLSLAFVLGFGLAYGWQHKPPQVPVKCVKPEPAKLYAKPWPKTWKA